MNLQSLGQKPRTPVIPKPAPQSPPPGAAFPRPDTVEILGSTAAIGLVCGLAVNVLGGGWGSALGIAGTGAALGTYDYLKSDQDKSAGALHSGLSGVVLGAAACSAAVVCGFHPVLGGLLAGGLMGVAIAL